MGLIDFNPDCGLGPPPTSPKIQKPWILGEALIAPVSRPSAQDDRRSLNILEQVTHRAPSGWETLPHLYDAGGHMGPPLRLDMVV